MASPLDTITSGSRLIARAIEDGIKQALQETGAAARVEHLKHADEVPGPDKKFSGTNRVNGGRLGVKVRYEYAEKSVRISPAGPWGLPAGRGRTKAGFKSWDKGEAATAVKADQIIPKAIDSKVLGAFRSG